MASNTAQTFAKNNPIKTDFPRVVVYCGADAKIHQSSLFYLHLFWAIIEKGRKLGFEMIPLMDTRPEKGRFGAPPEMVQIEKAGSIDGYVAIMAYDSMVEWIRETGKPLTVLNGSSPDVGFDMKEMAEMSIRRLAAQGAHSLGLMIPPEMANAEVLEMLDEVSEELNITINYEWIMVSHKPMEIKGYHQFQSLWDLKSKPDGLLIYPDVMSRGVVSAIVERRLCVPEDLKLILHRNAESPYVVPFPCDWIEMSADPIADGLLEALQAKLQGKQLPMRWIHFKLVPSERLAGF
ncbi:substrate-binding domain-containing protein [Puniceicoccus vermicola]|uniref:Substrate-binding domain-containing protein n=1 Tax=Puniceicoccus vermicola TaxID=388746 RepID=A0A7X1AYZ4_9BACT|nr:substrate-binding domain-containing protein [Puniceicoccus vermicola]MBC2602547.1 substrate-binding domain-containing protein [Puniceicoccus vermicola]